MVEMVEMVEMYLQNKYTKTPKSMILVLGQDKDKLRSVIHIVLDHSDTYFHCTLGEFGEGAWKLRYWHFK